MLDLLIRHATVVDGSGGPAFPADVGVKDGRIAAVERLEGASAARVIEARGQVVCPGFVDVHAHSDLPLLADPRNEPKVRQGVTTELLGADGLSYAPLSPPRLDEARRYLAALYGNPPAVASDWGSVAELLARYDRRAATNVLYVVPHQALRLETAGWRLGPATPDEVRRMCDLLREGLAQGALGLGTGLDYFPHGSCDTDELVALCQVVAEAGGVFVTHIRYNALGVQAAVRETVAVAERTGVRVLISHLRHAEALPIVDEALARGLDIAFDTYPYTAASSLLLSLLPFWVHQGGPDALLERLADPEVRARLRAEPHPRLLGDLSTLALTFADGAAEVHGDGNGNGAVHRGADAGAGAHGGRLAGHGPSLADVVAARGTGVVDTVCDLLLETRLAVGWVGEGAITEADIQACMRHPAHLVATDAIVVGSRPHPRGWGTYPRYLGRYVRDLGVLPLEQCVRRMTAAPAARVGLRDRGLLARGYAADLVVFDPARVRDRATYADPRQSPDGISHVVVNGTLVVDDGQPTGALPGRALRG